VNYDGKFHGKMPLRYAFANSYNVPAVKTLATINVSTMIEMGRKMGITTWNDPSRFGLSLALGGGEVTMIDLATTYGVLADAGKKVELNPILKVTDYRGGILQDSKIQKTVEEVISPNIAFIISDILSDNNARANAFGPNSQLVIPNHTVSVKTGTTNEKRDNWTIGYTPTILTAVWVGNNDNSPMHPYLTSGVTGAAPIWNKIMSELLKDKPDEKIPKPEGVTAVNICSFNGLLPCEGCPTRTEYFIKGTEPKIACKKIEPSPTPKL
jgi:membrane carboxypeptidase/penicillin-binding protein